ncbi:D-3-phosphoglycerate dehydrogenase [Hallerella porci]|uniref:D-3-phosphoglycerate dehydrogenase n=2 Tax=Hallerella porci TaxID=1945871 RepID=A0ABX5LKX6_9BACT|nr:MULTISPECIES: phosphoglycerate dehydrogenase [Hallerella]PWK95172.1 D-3-phosphoglycerate dehydrogenase [Hallerella porci]
MRKIKTMNNISQKGLGLFGKDYEVSESMESPDAILVRSAQVDTDSFDGLLAVARAGAGVNNITIDKASSKGICVFNTPGANANAVAELVMTILGMEVRHVAEAEAWVKALDPNDPALDKTIEKGKKMFSGTELSGKTLGVIGLGKIGVLVSNYARWKNMNVVAYDPYPSAANMHKLSNVVTVVKTIDEVIAKSDFLTVHVPFIKGVTENMLNEKNLAAFKGSIIMNFARGGIVNMDTVYKMIDENRLSAYLTDFADAKSLQNPKIKVFPHLGASTEEAEENCAVMAVEELKDYLEFGVVRNSVNFPPLDSFPHAEVKSRVVVINQDVPNMIAEITKVFGAANINIASFSNKSNGKIGYNLIDVESSVDDSIIDALKKLDKVIRVRVIHF